MNGFVCDLEALTLDNEDFRRVIYTAPTSQLVLMSLKPGEDIGEETHDLDQFIRVEEGEGKAYLNGVAHPVSDGIAIVVPAGVLHNIVNTSDDDDLKLYTVYSPPEHKDGTVHETKEDAEADVDDHFDGETSEIE